MRPFARRCPAALLAAALCAAPAQAAWLLSQKVYDAVAAAAAQAEDGQHDAARAALERLAARGSLNPYERAAVEQQLGAFASARGDYPKAASHFETALAADGLPEAFAGQLRYNTAQIYLALDRAGDALALLKPLFDGDAEPPPESYFSMASALHYLERDAEALEWAEQGLRGHPSPAEGHYALVSGLNLRLERWRRARELLQEMIRRFPDKAVYWRQLTAVWMELGDDKQALVVGELGHSRGVLAQGRDVLQLARLYLYHDFPHKAAHLLQRGLDDGVVAGKAAHWALLASAWSNAREHARAVAPLQKAAQLSDTGELFLRLARLRVEDEDWPRAHRSLAAALRRGGLADEPGARLLNGIVLAKLDRTAEAEAEFSYCLGFKTTRTDATRWLEYLGQANR
ncbi:MAG: hypothetical protein OXU50_03450 [Gammaproteobacteria bacterium]|nr:hypothetical protein [Gammaproteobacteria bacterium]